MAFKIGLIVNPFAGLGGSVALKGSDNVAKDALVKGAVPQAGKRCATALEALRGLDVELFTYAEDMGENCAQESGWPIKLSARQSIRLVSLKIPWQQRNRWRA